ncbi:MAG: tRNA (guanosine(46)-N7)-methyltransferase TrmB [Oscillospiraceae bacterium]|nr:tRNA (guanosine(46)-N7)-methyltransferase TrmB [Oscillospiraceae bacterium]
MRMRKKPNLLPRMERCASVLIREPEALRGNWRSLLPDAETLHVEIGCGKGKFTVETAKANPALLLIAVEKVPDAMVVATELAVRENVKNVFFVDGDAANLEDFFSPGEIDRIYLNFSDPWPRKKNAKRRLTYHAFLQRYARVLCPGGRLDIKTDNQNLFTFTLEELETSGLFTVQNITRNLHEHGPMGIMTGYEEKFYELGTPICRCEAVKRPIEGGSV